MQEFLDLSGKMEDWGPFRAAAKKTLMFSIGNPDEGHGAALSPDNDSRCANFVAYTVSERTGARFVAHIPYTTDRVGAIAKLWSPGYIPMDECVEKSVTFVRDQCKHLTNQSIKYEKVLIVVGHGGNNGIESYKQWNELAEDLGIIGFTFTGTFNIDIPRLLQALEPFSDETREAYLGVKPGHADTMEHSLALLYGGVDHGKLTMMNQFIQKHGIDAALQQWPVIGGLGGYLKFGGDEFEPLRKVSGLMACLRKFEEDGQIYLYPEFARLVMEISLDRIVQLVRPSEE